MRRRRGNSLLEFTLVGIPILFVLISTFEMARGMWLYHTLAYAVKEGTRYTSVHGYYCSVTPNACTVTVGQISSVIRAAGVGLLPDQLTLTFTPSSGTPITGTLANCLTNATTWPPAGVNQPGASITISGTYPFRSAMSMFWPGAGRPVSFSTINFPASSTEKMQF